MAGHFALVALGSNLGHRERNIYDAIEAIARSIGPISCRSALYDTEALSLSESDPQPNYLNAVIALNTDLPPEIILRELLRIELFLGRIRESDQARWLPRVIDLDLIGVDDLIVRTEMLTLPHPEMHRRLFVLEPLCEIYFDWYHPVLKMTAGELLAQCAVKISSNG